MPRKTGTVVESNISKGLITEASAMTFPQNAAFDLDNIVINQDTTVERRLGFDPEDSDSTAVTRSSSAVTEYVWENVAGSGTTTFLVQQIGNIIYFFNTNDDTIIAGEKAFTIDLSDYQTGSSEGFNCQFASGNGKLFIFHPFCESIYVTYDSGSDDITVIQIDLLIRDFEGVDDSLEIEERPSTLTDLHEYNLYNQGWYHGSQSGDGTHPSFGNSIATWRDLRAADPDDYPSNADIWWVFKGATTGFMETGPIKNFDLGNTPAPKGHFILKAFDTDRSGAHADIGTVTETDSGNHRPRTGAFFASRVWYAGIDAEGYQSKVYFSQIIERDEQIPWCYQENDPTAEQAFDLIDSDGGFVNIQEAGRIIKLFPMQDNILVMCTNGIWAITGSQGIGFKATDFAVRKVSGAGLTNPLSIVSVTGSPFWWDVNNIWTMQPDTSGTPQIQSLTDKTIQSFYNNISPIAKGFCKGAYNPITRIIQWVWRSSTPGSVDARYEYDNILCLNLNLQCFYTYSVQKGDLDTTPAIGGIFTVQNSSSTSARRNIFYYTTFFIPEGGGDHLIYSREFNEDYIDWVSFDIDEAGVDYSSFFFTGYKLFGDGDKDFQSNYFTTFLSNNSDNSGLLVQGLWDFATTDTSRFSAAQECYAWNDGFSVTTRRMKLRGHGKSLQLKFYSRAGKPFTWLGWAIEVSGNAAT